MEYRLVYGLVNDKACAGLVVVVVWLVVVSVVVVGLVVVVLWAIPRPLSGF